MLDLGKKRWVCVSSVIMKVYTDFVKIRNIDMKSRYGKGMMMSQ